MTETATEILLVAGMVNLLVGAITGIPMGLVRQGGAEVVPKYLTMLHMAGLMHGPILIAVGVALTISTLSPWIDTTAAVILAIASGLLLLKDTLNWRQGVADEFAEQTVGLRIGSLFGPLEIVGLAIATAGVISGI
ncbi:MAG: hypothetical protein ACXW2C_10915 [Acidimicrobiia bacterium]